MKRGIIIFLFFKALTAFGSSEQGQEIAEKIDFLTKHFHESLLQMAKQGPVNYQEALGNYHYALGMIVLDAQDITKQEKLRYLIGRDFAKERKAIIRSMIEEDRIDPNTICLHSPEISPLLNALLEEDLIFATYLMYNKATPDDDLRNRLEELRHSDNLVAQLLINHCMNDTQKGE